LKHWAMRIPSQAFWNPQVRSNPGECKYTSVFFAAASSRTCPNSILLRRLGLKLKQQQVDFQFNFLKYESRHARRVRFCMIVLLKSLKVFFHNSNRGLSPAILDMVDIGYGDRPRLCGSFSGGV
jgi:hypothetical protein